MKTIKILWVLAGFISYATINAQSSISFEASQLYTSFKFENSTGTSLNSEYSGIFTGAYNAGYRFIAENGFMLNVGLGMRKAGATMEYDAMNYSWDLQYFNGRLGLGYMLKKDKISPYMNIGGYYAYLLRGYQLINNEYFDIKKTNSLNTMDYGIIGTIGVNFSLSSTVSTYVETNYMMGMCNLEKSTNQKATNFAYGITLGVSYNISK